MSFVAPFTRTSPRTASLRFVEDTMISSRNTPVTSIVNTIQALFARQPVGADIWVALAWCLGILIVAYVLAMVTYRRRIR